jgi:hypothetical protein
VVNPGETHRVDGVLRLGNDAGFGGSYYLGAGGVGVGGNLLAGHVVVGAAGTGTFTQAGGDVATGSLVLASQVVAVGGDVVESGFYSLQDGRLGVSTLWLGPGKAQFKHDGGLLIVRDLRIGDGSVYDWNGGPILGRNLEIAMGGKMIVGALLPHPDQVFNRIEGEGEMIWGEHLLVKSGARLWARDGGNSRHAGGSSFLDGRNARRG